MAPFFLPLLIVALGVVAEIPRSPETNVTTIHLGEVAQRAARVAVHVVGLAETDLDIDHMATRARAGALLPEVRLRAFESGAGTKDYISDTGTVATNYYAPSFLIEASLTFHLDRLAYSGQEARLERLRLERIEARSRITQHVIDEISRWARAASDERDTPVTTESHGEAAARRTNAQMALDVWTGGWFSAYLAGREK